MYSPEKAFTCCFTGHRPEKLSRPEKALRDDLESEIRKAFAEEIPNTTKFIIAQRISSVQQADRILVLENGQISGFGSHEELLETNAIYRDVYESQTSGNGDFDEGGDE